MEQVRRVSRRLLALALPIVVGAALTGSASSASGQVHFKSPSGNINCYVFATDGGFADCLVRNASWSSTPQKPASCDLDWAPNEVELGRTSVRLGSCRGDVGPLCLAGNGRCTVLGYGHGVTVGSIHCDSAANGITCRRTTGRHAGFRVARGGVVVFR